MDETKQGMSESVVKIPEHLVKHGSDEVVALSPFDLATMGRPIPMVWFYSNTLPTSELLTALGQALSSCPILCGRYINSLPQAIKLNNAGISVGVCTEAKSGDIQAAEDVSVAGATAHVPNLSACPSFFLSTQVSPFLPDKEGMAVPDCGDNEECYLAKIKITQFPSGGSAIGMLVQHGVIDAEAQILFMRIWSQIFRKQEPTPSPILQRCTALPCNSSAEKIERPSNCKIRVIAPGEPNMPEFLPVLPTISGPNACIVPFSKRQLDAMKEASRAKIPAGNFVSTDDIVTALTWKSQCAARCKQLQLPSDSDEITTCARAWNFRMRTDPPLGKGFFANGVSQVWTELTVSKLLSMAVSEVALVLRRDLEQHTSETVSTRAAWLRQEQRRGCTTTQAFDKNALTTIISSWNFEWEAVDFNCTPMCFEHAAHVPFVSVLVPRPNGDGINVSASGTEEAVRTFAQIMSSEVIW